MNFSKKLLETKLARDGPDTGRSKEVAAIRRKNKENNSNKKCNF